MRFQKLFWMGICCALCSSAHASLCSDVREGISFENRRRPEPVSMLLRVLQPHFLRQHREFRPVAESWVVGSLKDGFAPAVLEVVSDRLGFIHVDASRRDYLSRTYFSDIHTYVAANEQVSSGTGRLRVQGDLLLFERLTPL